MLPNNSTPSGLLSIVERMRARQQAAANAVNVPLQNQAPTEDSTALGAVETPVIPVPQMDLATVAATSTALGNATAELLGSAQVSSATAEQMHQVVIGFLQQQQVQINQTQSELARLRAEQSFFMYLVKQFGLVAAMSLFSFGLGLLFNNSGQGNNTPQPPPPVRAPLVHFEINIPNFFKH